MGCCKNSSKTEVYSDKYLYDKIETSQINYLMLHIKELEKEETAQSQEKKGNNKQQSRNKTGGRKTTEKSKETKNWFCEMIKLTAVQLKKKQRELKIHYLIQSRTD